MNLELRFDYSSQFVFIPDGYIKNADELQMSFLEWVEDQPDCMTQDPGSSLALSYDGTHFVRYVNEVLLKDCGEKAYLLPDVKHGKVNRVIKF